MRILYLDTSSSYLYVALADADAGVLIDSIEKKLGADLSSKAIPLLMDLFANNKIEPDSINKIILVNGPGSFTGIRIGVTVAKIYSWSKQIDITTISSLEAMALSSNAEKDYIIPVIDARRKHVYSGIYSKDGAQVLVDQYLSLEAVLNAKNKLNGTSIFISNDQIEIDDDIEPYKPNYLKIIEAYKDKKNINSHEIDANYLKKTEAEEKKEDNNDKGSNQG